MSLHYAGLMYYLRGGIQCFAIYLSNNLGAGTLQKLVLRCKVNCEQSLIIPPIIILSGALS